MPPVPTKHFRKVEAPQPPVVPYWERAVWFFTQAGRARHHLLLAHQHPEDARRLEAVEKHAAAMHRNYDKLDENKRSLLAEQYFYVAWRSLEGGRVTKAAEALACLDQFASTLPSVPSLRLSLMDTLTNASDSGYLDQAKLFFADRRSSADKYTADILQVIDRLYCTFGAHNCRKVLENAHQTIRNRKIVQSAIALCACPAVIEREADNEMLSASDLDFSELMRIDAHLVNARLAECAGKIDTMRVEALAAYQLSPKSPQTIYWLTRANLYREPTGDRRISIEDGMTPPDDTAWTRLMLLVALYSDRSIPSAHALLPVLHDQVGPIGTTEARLVSRIVRLALENNPAATLAGNLGIVSELCRAVSKKLGAQPWTEFLIAYKDILLDQNYQTARDRLQGDGVRGYPGAEYLLRVALIMLGAPASPPQGREGDELALVETLMHTLFAPTPGSSADLDALLQSSHPSAFDSLTTRFPATAEAIKLLWLAWFVVAGKAKDVTKDLSERRSAKSAPAWVVWLHSRLCLLTGKRSLSDSDQKMGDVFQLRKTRDTPGPLLEAVCAQEADIHSRWISGRHALTQGLHELAEAILTALDGVIASSCLLTVAWWRPVNTYWLGVSYAHTHDPKAYLLLETLADGILKSQAIGQLALLDLEKGDITAAEQRLRNASNRVPSVRYATALFLSRTGKLQEACHLAGSEETAICFAGSPYAHAAKCLIAGIQERCGNREDAVHLLNEVLGAHPGHKGATLRLVRHGLENAYPKFQCCEPPVDVSPYGQALAQIVPRSTAGSTQANAYALLLDCLKASLPDALTATTQRVETIVVDPTRHLWWRQLLAARLLHDGDPASAGKMLQMPMPERASAPRAVERARAILGVWGTLSSLTDAGASEETTRRLEEQVRTLECLRTDDATANLWQTLARIGLSLIRGERVGPEHWRTLGDSPMSRIPFLFDHDAQTRRAAAEALLPVLHANPSPWSEEAGLLLNALTAWAMEKDDLFIEHYTTLEPVIDELPVAGRDLWVPAALIRYSREDWWSLTGASLPDCVADMSDPLVCLIVELADARAAIADLRNPSQTMAQRIKGIHNNLLALVERIDFQASETGVSETS